MHVIVFFFSLLVNLVTSRDSSYCYAKDGNPYLNLATKSSYNFMHGKLRPEHKCEPIQIFVVARHGTRYPRLDTIPKMKNLLQIRDRIVLNHLVHKVGHLCETDLKNLQNWELDENVNERMVNVLAPQAKVDFQGLATRLKAAFPDIFEETDSDSMKSKFVFRSTRTQRTEASMAEFMEGLLGSENAVIPEKVPKNDSLLRANRNCPSWEKDTKSKGFLEERNKFNNGPEMQKLLHDLSQRLGFSEDLSLDTVNTMYETCSYEKSWKIDEVSAWCAVFSKRELQTLEYREDLEYYYYAGPGRKINAKLGCPPMKDMFEHFQKLEGNEYSQEPKGIFYFAHSGTVQPLITSLGFNNDLQPLLASNFKTMAKRKWRTSFYGSFSTNLVAVFYKCYYGRSLNPLNKVKFYISERLVKYQGCEKGLCDWEFIKSQLGKKADDCNMDFCYNNESGTDQETEQLPSKSGWLHPEVIIV